MDGPALAAGDIVHDLLALNRQRAADDQLDHESPIEELFKVQVAAANLIVVSKADQLDQTQMTTARNAISSYLTTSTPMIAASKGQVSLEAILGINMEAEAFNSVEHSFHHELEDGHEKGHDHNHDEFTSFIIDMPIVESASKIKTQLARIALENGVLRAKGKVIVTGKALPLSIQAVGQRVDSFFSRETGQKTGCLVVIGLSGLDAKKIAAQLGGQLSANPEPEKSAAANASFKN